MKLLILVCLLILIDIGMCSPGKGKGKGKGRYREKGKVNVGDELDELLGEFKEGLMEPQCSVDLDCSNLAVLFTEDAIFAPQDAPPASGQTEVVELIELFKQGDSDIYLEVDFEDITECRSCNIISAYGIGTILSKDAAGDPVQLYQARMVFTFHREMTGGERKLQIKYWVYNIISAS
ncbi:unnamed protein product [Owenia fusiformis]|uniref:Uncharacterized protein n=1 Tax=Owenia fusiformis TaxID=6347 RepID=A0A8J1TXE5_OWEFU|nr:unnamed protein product [Owenia fusiformis]